MRSSWAARGSGGFAAQVPGAAGVAVASLPFFAGAPVRTPAFVMLSFMLLHNRMNNAFEGVCHACGKGLLCCWHLAVSKAFSTSMSSQVWGS